MHYRILWQLCGMTSAMGTYQSCSPCIYGCSGFNQQELSVLYKYRVLLRTNCQTMAILLVQAGLIIKQLILWLILI